MARTFYKGIILSGNILGEFCTDSAIFLSLESAYRSCQNVLESNNVYGYVIVEQQENSWRVVCETVYGVDYTVYEHNGTVQVSEGRNRYAIV